jgi:2-iminobutanoate/2-iminopropanoate deaminase
MRRQVTSPKAAPPRGIYSPAIVASGTMAFISGQGPVDPATGELRLGSFAEQAGLAFGNVGVLLEASGSSWAQAVKVGVFLADLGDFAEMNTIYKELLTQPYPARTTVQAVLPPGMLIEVDCIAMVPGE